MKNFKLLVILTGFLSALFRFGIFILLGIILVVIGHAARAQMCVAVGGAFIATKDAVSRTSSRHMSHWAAMRRHRLWNIHALRMKKG